MRGKDELRTDKKNKWRKDEKKWVNISIPEGYKW